MAQLVARLNGIQKARGSNPLVSTKKNIVQTYDIFLCGIGASHDFIVVLLCNMNPCGLTLTLLRKRPRYTSYESPCLHQKNIVQTYDIFLCGIGASHDFIVVLLCNMNPCGLTLTLLRKRPRHTSYESPCLHQKISYIRTIFFYVG